MPRRYLQTKLVGIMVIIVFVIDQFLKHKIRLTGGFYVCNSGISFGIKLAAFIFWPTIAFFILLAILLFLKKYAYFYLFPLSLLLSGALSNILDRFFYGCVVDYIHLPYAYLPSFNLADVAIFIGSIFLMQALLSQNSAQAVSK